MDDIEKRNGAIGVLENQVFQLYFNESYDAQLKILEFGDPSNPEALADAGKALRALRQLKRKFEKAANQQPTWD